MNNYSLKNVRRQFEDLCESYGYSYSSIPMFADASLYERYKGMPDEKYVKFIDRNSQVKVIRPDATFHVLKNIAEDSHTRHHHKIYYSTEIIREHAVHSQYGIESFNDESAMCDSEVIAVAILSLIRSGFDTIRADIGHAGFVSALIDEINCIHDESKNAVSSLIAKKNTVQLEDMLLSLGATKGEIKKLSEVCMLFGEYEDVIKTAEEFSVNEKMTKAVNEIKEIYGCLSSYGFEKFVFLDMGFANEMDYYSGMMFKIYSDKVAKAIINGGRYDDLARRFAGVSAACGFGADMDIISGIYDRANPEKDDTVTITSPKNAFKEIIAYSEMLRNSGYKVNTVFGENISYKYMGIQKDGLPTENDLREVEKNAESK